MSEPKPSLPSDPSQRSPKLPSLGVDIVPEPVLFRSGQLAVKLYSDFINVSLSSAQSARTYRSVTRSFFLWCERIGLDELLDVEPSHIKAYLHHRDVELGKTGSVQTHFAAVRSMFHTLVAGGYVATNPAASVKYQIHKGREGKTPVISTAEVRAIIDNIFDGLEAHSPAGGHANTRLPKQTDYRDRALIALMGYTFVRIGGALSTRLRDYTVYDGERWLEFGEKGGKLHKLPVLGEARTYLDDYIRACGLTDPDAPLFQSANRNGDLSGKPYDRTNALRMVKKRAAAAGVTGRVVNHTFRATGITRFLENDGSLDEAQTIANHADSSTTRLYDRRGKAGLITTMKKVRYD